MIIVYTVQSVYSVSHYEFMTIQCIHIICCFYIGDSPPPHEISSWFKSEGWGRTRETSVVVPHDIFVIGTQVGHC